MYLKFKLIILKKNKIIFKVVYFMFRINIIILIVVIYLKCYDIVYCEIYCIIWDFYVIIVRIFNLWCEILCKILNFCKSIDYMLVYK